MTITIPEFNYGGETQQNLDEYLNAVVSEHFDRNQEDLTRMSEGDLRDDIFRITEKAFSDDFEEVNLPNGETWSREEIQQAIRDTIEGRYG